MLVSLFTDASRCPRTNAGGWGAWWKSARCTRGMTAWGSFHTPVLHTHQAEARAIANGIRSAVRSDLVERGDHLLVQSDSMDAIRLLTGARRKAPGGHDLQLLEDVSRLQAIHGITLTLRWVKGHKTDGAASRHVVNEACDRMARKGMLIMRSQLQSDERTAP